MATTWKLKRFQNSNTKGVCICDVGASYVCVSPADNSDRSPISRMSRCTGITTWCRTVICRFITFSSSFCSRARRDCIERSRDGNVEDRTLHSVPIPILSSCHSSLYCLHCADRHPWKRTVLWIASHFRNAVCRLLLFFQLHFGIWKRAQEGAIQSARVFDCAQRIMTSKSTFSNTSSLEVEPSHSMIRVKVQSNPPGRALLTGLLHKECDFHRLYAIYRDITVSR